MMHFEDKNYHHEMWTISSIIANVCALENALRIKLIIKKAIKEIPFTSFTLLRPNVLLYLLFANVFPQFRTVK